MSGLNIGATVKGTEVDLKNDGREPHGVTQVQVEVGHEGLTKQVGPVKIGVQGVVRYESGSAGKAEGELSQEGAPPTSFPGGEATQAADTFTDAPSLNSFGAGVRLSAGAEKILGPVGVEGYLEGIIGTASGEEKALIDRNVRPEGERITGNSTIGIGARVLADVGPVDLFGDLGYEWRTTELSHNAPIDTSAMTFGAGIRYGGSEDKATSPSVDPITTDATIAGSAGDAISNQADLVVDYTIANDVDIKGHQLKFQIQNSAGEVVELDGKKAIYQKVEVNSEGEGKAEFAKSAALMALPTGQYKVKVELVDKDRQEIDGTKPILEKDIQIYPGKVADGKEAIVKTVALRANLGSASETTFIGNNPVEVDLTVFDPNKVDGAQVNFELVDSTGSAILTTQAAIVTDGLGKGRVTALDVATYKDQTPGNYQLKAKVVDKDGADHTTNVLLSTFTIANPGAAAAPGATSAPAATIETAELNVLQKFHASLGGASSATDATKKVLDGEGNKAITLDLQAPYLNAVAKHEPTYTVELRDGSNKVIATRKIPLAPYKNDASLISPTGIKSLAFIELEKTGSGRSTKRTLKVVETEGQPAKEIEASVGDYKIVATLRDKADRVIGSPIESSFSVEKGSTPEPARSTGRRSGTSGSRTTTPPPAASGGDGDALDIF